MGSGPVFGKRAKRIRKSLSECLGPTLSFIPRNIPMVPNKERILTPRDAARFIYRTKRPSAEQIEGVNERIRTGVLRGKKPAPKASFQTTTVGDVAQYLANQAYHRELGERSTATQWIDSPRGEKGNGPAFSHCQTKEGQSLRGIYGDILKDYALALMFRRSRRQVSRWFIRAVLAGQVIILLLIMSVTVLAFQSFSPVAPVEQQVVERWLGEHEPGYRILEWFSPQIDPEGGLTVRVRYHYRTDRGKGIDTDRIFVVRDDYVVAVLGSTNDD